MSSNPQPVARVADRPRLAAVRGLILALVLVLLAWLGPSRYRSGLALILEVATIAVLALWWVGKVRGRQPLVVSSLTAPFLIYAAAVAVSAAASDQWRISSEALLYQLAIVAFFFALSDRVHLSWGNQPLIIALLGAATVLIAQGLLTVGEWYRFWWHLRVPQYPTFPLPFRLLSVAENANLLAAILVLALPLAAANLYRAKNRLAQAGWAAWLLSLEVVLYFTRSRGGTIAALAALALLAGWLVYSEAGGDYRRLREGIRAHRRALAVLAVYLALFGVLAFADARISSMAVAYHEAGLTAGRASRWAVAIGMFADSPAIGTGPGTFAREYVGRAAVTRAAVSRHAHNLALQTLGETGLFGAGAVLLLLGAGGLALAKAVRDQTHTLGANSDRALTLAAATSSLGGWLTHSLVDHLTWTPFVAIALVMVACVGLDAASNLRKSRRRLTPTWLVLLPMALVLAAVILIPVEAGRGRLAAATDQALKGDWLAAAQSVAAAIGADPAEPLYYSQAAFARAMAALQTGDPFDAAALDAAADLYRRSLATEPLFVPNYLNAAHVFAIQGAKDDATALLEAAAGRGTDWPLAYLLLADQRLAAGAGPDSVARLYAEAFRADPGSVAMAACQRQALCIAVGTYSSEGGAGLPSEMDTLLAALLENARYQAGLNRASDYSLQQGGYDHRWIRAAREHGQRGETRQALYCLEMAARRGEPRAEISLARAEMLVVQGKTDLAIEVLEELAFPTLAPEMLRYSLNIYGRVALPGLLLPQLAALERTETDLEAYRLLADLYSLTGDEPGEYRARALSASLEAALAPAESQSPTGD